MFKWQYWHKCLALHCNWVFHFWSFITSFKNNLLPHEAGGRGQAEINISIEWEILVIQSFFFCAEENRSAYKKALTFFFQNERVQKKKTVSFLLNSFSVEIIYFTFLLKKSHSILLSQTETSHINSVPCSTRPAWDTADLLLSLSAGALGNATCHFRFHSAGMMHRPLICHTVLARETSKWPGKVAAQETAPHLH